MRIKDKRLWLMIIAVAILVVGIFSYIYTHNRPDPYVAFAMEAYDSIEKNYWAPHDRYNLPQLFELSLEKVLNTPHIAAPTDRVSTQAAVARALAMATSTAAEKQDVLQVVAVVLYNLEPTGRDALMSNSQVKSLRDEVSNKNPSTGEVQPTIASKASVPGAVVKPASGAEVVGKTLYVRISQIAPTTLQEFADAVNAASTTPLDSLIIDLRGNIGGDLNFMPSFLGLWIGNDQYAFDLYSQGNKNVIRTTQNKYDPLTHLETAVLIDGQTQSTAELTADAFRRYHLGTLVGTQTRGWGTVENTYPLTTPIDPETSYSLYLVNSLTVRSDDQPIEGNGVPPDINTSKAGWQSALGSYFHSASLVTALRTIAATSTPQS